jgi:hypothetical protein
MPKLTQNKIKQIVKALEKASFAINALEKATGNKMMFFETKAEVQQLSQELKERYPDNIGINATED